MKTSSFLVLLALASMQNSALAGTPINESRDVDADALISIEIINGTISISGWDDNVFHIEGELSEAAKGFDLRSSQSKIHFEEDIEHRYNWGWRGFRSNRPDQAEAKLDIQVPRTSILRFEGTNTYLDISGLSGNTEIHVTNGDIDASQLQGVIRLETVNGNIDTRQLSGRVNLETINGNINDRNSSGTRVSLETVNGRIRSNNSGSRISASNINGSIELLLAEVNDLEVTTVGGSIEVSAAMKEQAQIEMSSVHGSIQLNLPATTSASVHVSTAVGGRIRNQLTDDEAVRENRYVNSRELNFVMNGGSADVDISTVSGNITLHPCGQDECGN